MPRNNLAPKTRPSIPHGADPTRYRPGIKKEQQSRINAAASAWDGLSPEEKAARIRQRHEYEEDMRQWRIDFDRLGPVRAEQLMKQRRDQRRIVSEIVDFEARIAVEGDTAMDDVPFGESGE